MSTKPTLMFLSFFSCLIQALSSNQDSFCYLHQRRLKNLLQQSEENWYARFWSCYFITKSSQCSGECSFIDGLCQHNQLLFSTILSECIKSPTCLGDLNKHQISVNKNRPNQDHVDFALLNQCQLKKARDQNGVSTCSFVEEADGANTMFCELVRDINECFQYSNVNSNEMHDRCLKVTELSQSSCSRTCLRDFNPIDKNVLLFSSNLTIESIIEHRLNPKIMGTFLFPRMVDLQRQFYNIVERLQDFGCPLSGSQEAEDGQNCCQGCDQQINHNQTQNAAQEFYILNIQLSFHVITVSVVLLVFVVLIIVLTVVYTRSTNLERQQRAQFDKKQNEPLLDDKMLEDIGKYHYTLPASDENSEQEDTCPICLSCFEEGEVVVDLKCSHVFHESCFKSWAVTRGVDCLCPVCRSFVFVCEEKTSSSCRNSQPRDVC